MKITKKEQALINDWIELHQEIEKLEEEIRDFIRKLRQISGKLYDKGSKDELVKFRDSLAEEIKKIDRKTDNERKKQLTNLKSIVEHDINIETLVEQDIDIEEQGVKIDLLIKAEITTPNPR